MDNPNRMVGPCHITHPNSTSSLHSEFSITQICTRTGRGRATILRWIAEGKLRAEIIARPQGPQYRIYLSEAEIAALVPPPRRGDGLTVREVAEQLGCTPYTVRQWIRDGKLAASVREHPQGRYYDIAPGVMDALARNRAARPAKPEHHTDAIRERDMTIAALRHELRELRVLIGGLNSMPHANETHCCCFPVLQGTIPT